MTAWKLIGWTLAGSFTLMITVGVFRNLLKTDAQKAAEAEARRVAREKEMTRLERVIPGEKDVFARAALEMKLKRMKMGMENVEL